MSEIHMKLVEDHMPEDVSALIEYLREMACVHPQSGERQMPSKTDDAVFDMAANALERMQSALQNIENPMDHFRQMAADEGAVLDASVALNLADDPNYLKGIARSALTLSTPHTPTGE